MFGALTPTTKAERQFRLEIEVRRGWVCHFDTTVTHSLAAARPPPQVLEGRQSKLQRELTELLSNRSEELEVAEAKGRAQVLEEVEELRFEVRELKEKLTTNDKEYNDRWVSFSNPLH